MRSSAATIQISYDYLERGHVKEIPLEDVRPASTAITEEVRALYDYLENNYCEVKNEDEVRSFLLKQPNLILYLRGAFLQIYENFGLGQRTSLEVVFDPEEEGAEELFLNIETNLEPEEALARLDRIDEDWLLPVVNPNVQKFNLNIEFK